MGFGDEQGKIDGESSRSISSASEDEAELYKFMYIYQNDQLLELL